MFVIDNNDAIRGIAEVASKLDFTVHGTVAYVPVQLADGQLGNAEADLYASGADATMVTLITITNTDSVARTFTLYLKPSAGTSRAISPISLDLGIGHTFYTDGRRMWVMDASGQILSTWAVDDTAGGTNGLTAIPISSNVHYDHVNAADPHAGYVLESVFDAHTILIAIGDNTPVKLDVAASRMIARLASGNIVAATGAQIMALLSGQAGAEFLFGTQKVGGVVDPTTNQQVATKKYVDDNVGISDAGEGHILLIPATYDSIGQGTWVIGTGAARVLGYFSNSGTNADGDEMSWKAYLAAGTYTAMLLSRNSSGSPIVDLYIDAAEIASWDLYAGSTDEMVRNTPDTGNVVTAGLKTIKLVINGKNGSSSGYTLSASYIALWRTA